jgi:hypothetical protein
MLLNRSFTALARERVHWWPVALLAIPADLILARIPVTEAPWLIDAGHWLWVGTLLIIAAVLVRNALARRSWRRAPWLLAALGTGLNLVVIFANDGYMPVETNALNETGMAAQLDARPRYRRDVPVTSQTRLVWLSDVLVDPAWLPRRTVLSVGDLVLVSGLGWWLIQMSWRRAGVQPAFPTRRPGAEHAGASH